MLLAVWHREQKRKKWASSISKALDLAGNPPMPGVLVPVKNGFDKVTVVKDMRVFAGPKPVQ